MFVRNLNSLSCLPLILVDSASRKLSDTSKIYPSHIVWHLRNKSTVKYLKWYFFPMIFSALMILWFLLSLEYIYIIFFEFSQFSLFDFSYIFTLLFYHLLLHFLYYFSFHFLYAHPWPFALFSACLIKIKCLVSFCFLSRQTFNDFMD